MSTADLLLALAAGAISGVTVTLLLCARSMDTQRTNDRRRIDFWYAQYREAVCRHNTDNDLNAKEIARLEAVKGRNLAVLNDRKVA